MKRWSHSFFLLLLLFFAFQNLFSILFSTCNFATVVIVATAATIPHVELFSLFIWKLTDDPSTFGRLFNFMLAMNNIFKTIKRKRTVATVIFIYWIGFDPIYVEYWSCMYIHHPSFICICLCMCGDLNMSIGTL